MRILVTGACGKLGRAVRQAGAREHTFVLLDVVEAVEAEGGLRGSVADRETVKRAAEGCDAIIHTAAMHGLFKGKATNQQFLETNVIGAENLFEAALLHGIKRIVLSSTLEVIIGEQCDAYGTAIIDEDTPPRPDWIYPVTKLQAEILGSYYAREHGLEVVSLRYGNILPWTVEKMAFELLARGLHTDEYARANLLAVTVPGLTDHVFHCAAETPLRRPDILAAMKNPWPVLDRYWPGSSETLQSHGLTPAPKYFFPVTRIDKARQILGWRPQITFADYLRLLGWNGLPAFSVGEARNLTQ